jgi:ribosomal protein S18 acetylase RimI-like enzyme
VKTVVRAATAGDYDDLCTLFGQVDALHRDNLPQIFHKPTGPVREQEYYRGLLTDENVGLFVAEMSGKLVGVVHAAIRDTPPIPVLVPRRYAIVDSIGVKSEFRGRGIGSTLMHRIHEWAIAKGATAIELNVYEFNRDAIDFYHRLGYDTVSRRMRKSLDKAEAAGEPALAPDSASAAHVKRKLNRSGGEACAISTCGLGQGANTSKSLAPSTIHTLACVPM